MRFYCSRKPLQLTSHFGVSAFDWQAFISRTALAFVQLSGQTSNSVNRSCPSVTYYLLTKKLKCNRLHFMEQKRIYKCVWSWLVKFVHVHSDTLSACATIILASAACSAVQTQCYSVMYGLVFATLYRWRWRLGRMLTLSYRRVIQPL